MNPELQAQTDAILKALNTLHDDNTRLFFQMLVISFILGILLGFVIFRRR